MYVTFGDIRRSVGTLLGQYDGCRVLSMFVLEKQLHLQIYIPRILAGSARSIFIAVSEDGLPWEANTKLRVVTDPALPLNFVHGETIEECHVTGPGGEPYPLTEDGVPFTQAWLYANHAWRFTPLYYGVNDQEPVWLDP